MHKDKLKTHKRKWYKRHEEHEEDNSNKSSHYSSLSFDSSFSEDEEDNMLKISKPPDEPRKSVLISDTKTKLGSLILRRMEHRPFLSPEDKFLRQTSSRSIKLSRTRSKSYHNSGSTGHMGKDSLLPEVDDKITDIDITKEKIPILFYSEKDLNETAKRISKFQRIQELERMHRRSTVGKEFLTQKKISTTVPIKLESRNPPSIYNKFYYKNLLVVDKDRQHFNNAIFEVFEAEYNKETQLKESSSEKSSSSITGEDYYNILGENTTFREQIPEEAEGEIEPESEENETTSFGQTPQNELQIRKLMNNSGKFLKLRKKTSVGAKFKKRLMGDRSMRQLFDTHNQKKKQLQFKSTLNEKPYGAVEDPIAMFYQGKNSMVSESLDSITSQNEDSSSNKEIELFTYVTEKKLFAPPSLKKKKQKKHSKPQFTRNQSESVGFL